MALVIQVVDGPAAFAEALAVRVRVFVEEQKVPIEHEQDAIDDTAHHVLGRWDGQAVGTARAFPNPADPGEAIIGRVAVLREWRGRGIASALMRHLLDWCRAGGFRGVRLHAQCAVIPLYASLGFRPIGDVFLEEGIEHREMVLVFSDGGTRWGPGA